jgi:hypothetical protein
LGGGSLKGVRRGKGRLKVKARRIWCPAAGEGSSDTGDVQYVGGNALGMTTRVNPEHRKIRKERKTHYFANFCLPSSTPPL